MARFVLVYRGDSIELQPGETLVGRALTCRLRFNDPAVSRVHARFLVEETTLILEDMGSANGTRVNGSDLKGTTKLSRGDQIQIGHRWLQLEVVDDGERPSDEFPTVDRGERWSKQHDILPEAEEETIDRGNMWTGSNEATPAPRVGEDTLDRPQGALRFSVNELSARNCPHCHRLVPSNIESCPSCAFSWPAGRPSSVTQRIKLEAIDRRVEQRLPVEIPILYASETLTLDTVARDISHGGMFVASELLDPIGTSCEITVLPDGRPAVSLEGIVCHVVQNESGEDGRPPGLGVRFTSLSAPAEKWLDSILSSSSAGAHPSRTAISGGSAKVSL